jgi:hypothetical protein
MRASDSKRAHKFAPQQPVAPDASEAARMACAPLLLCRSLGACFFVSFSFVSSPFRCPLRWCFVFFSTHIQQHLHPGLLFMRFVTSIIGDILLLEYMMKF